MYWIAQIRAYKTTSYKLDSLQGAFWQIFFTTAGFGATIHDYSWRQAGVGTSSTIPQTTLQRDEFNLVNR